MRADQSGLPRAEHTRVLSQPEIQSFSWKYAVLAKDQIATQGLTQTTAADVPVATVEQVGTATARDLEFEQKAQQEDGRPATRILGTGSYIPHRIVTNDELAQHVDTSDDWIRARTGIQQRRRAAADETTSDMAVAAAKSALAASGISASELDLIVVATVTPDQPLPTTSIHVKEKLGITNHCPAFDLAAACSGFIYGLHVADSFIKSGMYQRILLVGVELLSRVVDWTDRESCIIFGDGAGAVVLASSNETSSRSMEDETFNGSILSTRLFSDSSMADAIEIPAGGSAEPMTCDAIQEGRQFVKMQGRRVFKFAVDQLTKACRDILRDNGLTARDIDWVVPHQANMRILQLISEQCEIPMERFLTNIEKYGNTSSASCPLALDEGVRSNQIKRGDTILFCAIGSGMVWGCSLVRY